MGGGGELAGFMFVVVCQGQVLCGTPEYDERDGTPGTSTVGRCIMYRL